MFSCLSVRLSVHTKFLKIFLLGEIMAITILKRIMDDDIHCILVLMYVAATIS